MGALRRFSSPDARSTLPCGQREIRTLPRVEVSTVHQRLGRAEVVEAVQVHGASQRALDRGEGLESHAYAFIHTANTAARVAQLFGEQVQFDLIVGTRPINSTMAVFSGR